MQQGNIVQPLLQKPLFDPTYLNIEYIFDKIYNASGPAADFFLNGHTWVVIGIISSLISIFLIAIILFSLVRLREIQVHEKHEVDHHINAALARDKESARAENPRWHYIQTLIESPNESDWRVAIIEADAMLEELLRQRGFEGNTVSELLEGAKGGGFATIQSAWDAHIVRNQIAHQGLDFPLTQVEGRRVIKMYQNTFEELQAI
jgi:hypothetical protein